MKGKNHRDEVIIARSNLMFLCVFKLALNNLPNMPMNENLTIQFSDKIDRHFFILVISTS
jgi:hypothetical protein